MWLVVVFLVWLPLLNAGIIFSIPIWVDGLSGLFDLGLQYTILLETVSIKILMFLS